LERCHTQSVSSLVTKFLFVVCHEIPGNTSDVSDVRTFLLHSLPARMVSSRCGADMHRSRATVWPTAWASTYLGGDVVMDPERTVRERTA